jgi:hypothetical protein
VGLGRDSRVNSAVTAGGKAAATAAANARAKATGMQISTTSGSSSSSRSVRHRDAPHLRSSGPHFKLYLFHALLLFAPCSNPPALMCALSASPG